MQRPPIQIEIFSRPGCHLCDEAKATVENVARRIPVSIRVVNIEDDPELESRYGTEIPVIFINGSKAFKYRVDENQLEAKVKRLWKT
jgi:glutaredoxin